MPTKSGGVTDATLDDILITEELARRPARPPNHPAEIAALHALSQRLADCPESMFDTLNGLALDLCRAGSAGLSLLETDADGSAIFRWKAIGGALAPFVGGWTPRDFSPCGVVLDRGSTQLFRHQSRYFTYFDEAHPPIVEGLVVPVRWKGDALGTIWIASHDQSRRFDREDVRVMESIAGFTAAALCVQDLRRRDEQHCEQLEARVVERTTELIDSHARHDAARSEWLRTLMNAQEDERRRVARELHDEMSQHLTGLALNLHALGQADDETRGSILSRLEDLVSQIDRGIHRVARDLRPAALDDLGLVCALDCFAAEWSRIVNVSCEFSHHRCKARLPAPIETTFYRIAQEALTNVARHAHATHVSVMLECHGDRATLTVDDNGVGFDVDASATTRFGLMGIRERAALLGGTIQVESSEAGTTLFVTLPLASACNA